MQRGSCLYAQCGCTDEADPGDPVYVDVRTGHHVRWYQIGTTATTVARSQQRERGYFFPVDASPHPEARCTPVKLAVLRDGRARHFATADFIAGLIDVSDLAVVQCDVVHRLDECASSRYPSCECRGLGEGDDVFQSGVHSIGFLWRWRYADEDAPAAPARGVAGGVLEECETPVAASAMLRVHRDRHLDGAVANFTRGCAAAAAAAAADRPRILLLELFGGTCPVAYDLARREEVGGQVTLVGSVLCDVEGVNLPMHCGRNSLHLFDDDGDLGQEANVIRLQRIVDECVGACDILVVVGGPPCTAYSNMSYCNPSVRWPHHEEAMAAGDRLARAFLRVVQHALDACARGGKTCAWLMENPHAHEGHALRSRAVLREFAFLGPPRRLNYCKYGNMHPPKPTDIWTNVPGLQLRHCNNACCNISVLTRRHRMTVQDTSGSVLRAVWPDRFVIEVVDALLSAWTVAAGLERAMAALDSSVVSAEQQQAQDSSPSQVSRSER